MSGNKYWDNSGLHPNLSRLPAHIREGMTTPFPIRNDESHAALMLFSQSAGLNHPNARLNITPFRRESSSGIVSIDRGAQVDFADFSGRLPLVTSIISQDSLPKVIAGLLRVYETFGGDVDALVADARTVRAAAEETVFFEERNDE